MPELDEGKQEEREKGTYCEMCGATSHWMHLGKCPMCHKYFCDSCRHTFGGKDFCSRHCGNEFFWGGEDGDVEE
jgi:hypothetical protein